jgi:hypothetical protein
MLKIIRLKVKKVSKDKLKDKNLKLKSKSYVPSIRD